jgi:hypothetical protein
MPPSIATLFAEFITTTSLIEGTGHHDADIYNEFSLQHEFGSYLRRLFPQNKSNMNGTPQAFRPSKARSKSARSTSLSSHQGVMIYTAPLNLSFPATANIRRRCLAFAGISPSSNSSNATVFRPLAR